MLQRMFEQKVTTKARSLAPVLAIDRPPAAVEASGAIHLQSRWETGRVSPFLLPVKKLV
jgi:hypothetical protein